MPGRPWPAQPRATSPPSRLLERRRRARSPPQRRGQALVHRPAARRASADLVEPIGQSVGGVDDCGAVRVRKRLDARVAGQNLLIDDRCAADPGAGIGGGAWSGMPRRRFCRRAGRFADRGRRTIWRAPAPCPQPAQLGALRLGWMRAVGPGRPHRYPSWSEAICAGSPLPGRPIPGTRWRASPSHHFVKATPITGGIRKGLMRMLIEALLRDLLPLALRIWLLNASRRLTAGAGRLGTALAAC
jgi:hypothetical protein